MPKPEIRRTSVQPDADGTCVELHISDEQLLAASPETLIVLAMRLGTYEYPHLAHLEIEALEAALRILGDLRDERTHGLRSTGHPTSPRPAKP